MLRLVPGDDLNMVVSGLKTIICTTEQEARKAFTQLCLIQGAHPLLSPSDIIACLSGRAVVRSLSGMHNVIIEEWEHPYDDKIPYSVWAELFKEYEKNFLEQLSLLNEEVI